MPSHSAQVVSAELGDSVLPEVTDETQSSTEVCSPLQHWYGQYVSLLVMLEVATHLVALFQTELPIDYGYLDLLGFKVSRFDTWVFSCRAPYASIVDAQQPRKV